MTWTFHAGGDTQEPRHERRLMAELHKLFGDPTYGINHSSFSGAEVSGEVHGEGYEGPDPTSEGIPTPQEPQRMDPPELQQPGPLPSLNPAHDPEMPIDRPNAVPPLDAGPSDSAANQAREHAEKLKQSNEGQKANGDVKDERDGSIVGDNPTEEKHESSQGAAHEQSGKTQLGTEGNPVHVQEDNK
jgi:hypothetical protein